MARSRCLPRRRCLDIPGSWSSREGLAPITSIHGANQGTRTRETGPRAGESTRSSRSIRKESRERGWTDEQEPGTVPYPPWNLNPKEKKNIEMYRDMCPDPLFWFLGLPCLAAAMIPRAARCGAVHDGISATGARIFGCAACSLGRRVVVDPQTRPSCLRPLPSTGGQLPEHDRSGAFPASTGSPAVPPQHTTLDDPLVTRWIQRVSLPVQDPRGRLPCCASRAYVRRYPESRRKVGGGAA